MSNPTAIEDDLSGPHNEIEAVVIVTLKGSRGRHQRLSETSQGKMSR